MVEREELKEQTLAENIKIGVLFPRKLRCRSERGKSHRYQNEYHNPSS
jgi:hypothetical protein